MPAVAPFRALTYAPRLRPILDRVVAPPYDVLTEVQRAGLLARHEENVVHVDLPRPSAGDEPYAGAARLLDRWIRDEVLVRDTQAALYVCEQRYSPPSGGEATRRGFFARLTLEPFGSGSILPHERTLEEPRADRGRLLAATRTHLSAVFLLHSDPGGDVAGMIAGAMDGETFLQARDDDGTLSRVVRVGDRERVESITHRLRDQWALIADGHHRYESALAYRDERRARGFRDAEHVLVFLCSIEDSGLAIFPIHRLVHSLAGFDEAGFRARLAPLFRLTRARAADDLRGAVSSRSAHPGVFGLVFPGDSYWLLEWIEGEGLERKELAPIPVPLRRLDVVLLHHLLLEGVLGITPGAQARQSHLDYVKDDREVYERVAMGRAQIGVLMNPTRIPQVIEVTRAGLRLPQKSTYFFPKVLTGLVFDPLD
jgi:uncharacterized protein (DUF1015 family)